MIHVVYRAPMHFNDVLETSLTVIEIKEGRQDRIQDVRRDIQEAGGGRIHDQRDRDQANGQFASSPQSSVNKLREYFRHE